MDKTSGNIIHIDECLVKAQVGEVVRETVEQTLNRLLDAEEDALCKAQRYERSAVSQLLVRKKNMGTVQLPIAI